VLFSGSNIATTVTELKIYFFYFSGAHPVALYYFIILLFIICLQSQLNYSAPTGHLQVQCYILVCGAVYLCRCGLYNRTYCLHIHGLLLISLQVNPEDRDSMFLRNAYWL
jgi:hypothetical protein